MSAGIGIDEHRDRVARAQLAMQQAGIDLLWLTTEPEFFWFTGYLTAFWQSPTRAWHLLVPASGDPVAVIPSIGAACYSRTGFTDARCFDSPHPHSLGVELVLDAVKELVGDSPIIGRLEGPGTSARVPLGDIARLEAGLPLAQWRDATDLVHRLRQIKSPSEIERLKTVCKLVSDLFDAVPALVSRGDDERSVFRAVRQKAHALGIDEVPFLVGGAGAGGIRDIIAPPTSRAIDSGDILLLDTGCRMDGYFSDFDRNWAIGHAPHAAATAYSIAWEATEAGLDAVRPGRTCAELYHAMHQVLAPHDTDRTGNVGRLGHGLGIELTETPSITPYDHTVLEPGMVLTIEPALTYGDGHSDGYVMVHEENIVVTESGYQMLSRRAPAELPVI